MVFIHLVREDIYTRVARFSGDAKIFNEAQRLKNFFKERRKFKCFPPYLRPRLVILHHSELAKKKKTSLV